MKKVRLTSITKQQSAQEPIKIKSAEKDQLIAELRQQLYDLKNQERDYKGVNDEILNMENRYKILSDDKVTPTSPLITLGEE